MVLRDPHRKTHGAPRDILCRAGNTKLLRGVLTDVFGIAGDRLVIARRDRKKATWAVISGPTLPAAEPQKKKKKQKQQQQQQQQHKSGGAGGGGGWTPVTKKGGLDLKDGDMLAVKDLADDPEDADDFSTREDRAIIAAQKAEAVEKRVARATGGGGGGGGGNSTKRGKSGRSNRKRPVEVAIKIDVS